MLDLARSCKRVTFVREFSLNTVVAREVHGRGTPHLTSTATMVSELPDWDGRCGSAACDQADPDVVRDVLPASSTALSRTPSRRLSSSTHSALSVLLMRISGMLSDQEDATESSRSLLDDTGGEPVASPVARRSRRW